MIHAFHASLQPIANINRRVSIGGSVLSLLMAAEVTMTLLRPLA